MTKLLTELREYIERLKHRADVRGGPDVSAMGIADEAIALIDAALAQPQYVSSECRMVPWCPKPAKNESCIRCGRLYERPQDSPMPTK